MRRRRWKFGGNAGTYFPLGGDLTVSTWVKSPRGEQMILTQVCGFRDTPEGCKKCTLDRYLMPYPASAKAGDS